MKSGISSLRTRKALRSVAQMRRPTGSDVPNMRRKTSALRSSPIEVKIVTKVPYRPHRTALAMTIAAETAKPLSVPLIVFASLLSISVNDPTSFVMYPREILIVQKPVYPCIFPQ